MGDLQCSVFANLLRPGLDAVVNISTSGQLGFVMPKEFQPDNLEKGANLLLLILQLNIQILCSQVKTCLRSNISPTLTASTWPWLRL